VKKVKKIKKIFFALLSFVGVLLIFWFLVLGKIRAEQLLKPLLSRIPKSSSDLKEVGSDVLGTAEEAATSENAQKVLQEGAKFFETSVFTEPLRILKENLNQRIVETVETIRELPAKEVRTIKKEVCKQWLEEDNESTPTATP